MAQADFQYEPANDRVGLPCGVAIYADRPYVRAEMRDDAEAAGFGLTACGALAELPQADDGLAPGEVVLLDCPAADAGTLAALCRLDMRAAQSGAQLVVSTTVEALDAIFACLDQSNPQILVDPSRAERVIALGRALAHIPNLRVRDLSPDDRLMLLRLTEQVAQIADRLDTLCHEGGARTSSTWQVEAPRRGFRGANATKPRDRLVPVGNLAWPDPQLVRQIIRQRQARARFFDAALFADPAWDILLDLTAAHAEGARVSVTSLCIAAGVPPTTALRWITQMTESGLLQRMEDDVDRRRAFIGLAPRAAEAMIAYFAELGGEAGHLV